MNWYIKIMVHLTLDNVLDLMKYLGKVPGLSSVNIFASYSPVLTTALTSALWGYMSAYPHINHFWNAVATSQKTFSLHYWSPDFYSQHEVPTLFNLLWLIPGTSCFSICALLVPPLYKWKTITNENWTYRSFQVVSIGIKSQLDPGGNK